MSVLGREKSWLRRTKDPLQERLTLFRARRRRRRWWRVAERVVAQIDEDNISLLAAGVAFFVFLSIPALFSGLLSLYGLGFETSDVDKQIQALQGLIPENVIAFLGEQSKRIVQSSERSLGIGLAASVIVAVVSGRGAMLSLMSALNRAFDTKETRHFLVVQAVALALALHVILFALCALILVAIVPVILALAPLGAYQKTAASLLQWGLLIALEFMMLTAFYRLAPANRARRRWLSPGALLAAILWLIASGLFSLYVEFSASYSRIYGSVAGVVVLMTWLYISFYVVLLGAELNAALAFDRKAKPSKSGPGPLPKAPSQIT